METSPGPGQAAGAPASDTPDDSLQSSPTGLEVADSWAEAADQTGTVRATKQVPEPDSLGG